MNSASYAREIMLLAERENVKQAKNDFIRDSIKKMRGDRKIISQAYTIYRQTASVVTAEKLKGDSSDD